MPTLKRLALFLIGVALVVALWAGGQRLETRGRDSQASNTKPTTTQRPPVDENAAPSARNRPARERQIGPFVRRIAPGTIAGPEITGPLERIAPRMPPVAATKPLKREPFGPPVPKGTLLYQPVAKSAGEIEANGHTVRLAGIKITRADRTCSVTGGPSWPCGVVARTAFRSWMRGRAVACDVPSRPGAITTHCTLDGEDMALWLVENGWAASADGQYDDAEAKARKEKKGLFGPSPLVANR